MTIASAHERQDDIAPDHCDNGRQQNEPEGVDSYVNKKNDSRPESSSPKSRSTFGIMMTALARLGLDASMVKVMLKGAIPPIVALAINQSNVVAEEFKTYGYFAGIVAALSDSSLPRGRFIQRLMLSLIIVAIGSAVALLVLWSAHQARLYTQTEPDDPNSPPTYNSSQAAVSAVWLFVNVWAMAALRAKYPSLFIPSVNYTIFISLICTSSVQIGGRNSNFEVIVKRLLTAMLTGFGIATATSLFILPTSSRSVTVGQFKQAIQLLRGVLKQERAYLQSLEREDMFAVPADITASTHLTDSARPIDEADQRTNDKKHKRQPEPKTTAEAKAVKDTIFKLRLLVGKIYVDLPFAKRDFAWAKLATKDLTTILELIRGVVVPVHGIGTVIDIFQRRAEKRGWITTEETPLDVLADITEDKRVWNEVMKQLHEPFEKLSAAIDEGLQHAGMLLEILPRPKHVNGSENKADRSTLDPDVESKGDLVKPGDAGFKTVLEGKIQSIRDIRSTILHAWAKEKGLVRTDSDLDDLKDHSIFSADGKHNTDQEQLYVLLYIQTLMEAAGEAVLRFVHFADNKVADGTMERKRVIVPRPKVLFKWIKSIFGGDDKQENETEMYDSNLSIIKLGDGFFASKRDPEHLPPTNTWQRAGNAVRSILKFFSSPESAFGFRCACAGLTVGIVAFLEDTHVFFQNQRLVWGLIIISISMTPTSGQSIFGFLCRIFGTFVAVVSTLVSWYIVDEHVPGIFIFMYLFMAISFYFLHKYPQFTPGIMISMLSQILILGYELQVLEIGVQSAEASGQQFYRIYKLAPYRLANIAGGCLVAFFWTIFPSPLSERTSLRRDLAATLHLLANYFSVIHETLKNKHTGTGGDHNLKGTPAYRLAKHRLRLFDKLMLLLPSLQQHLDFQRWEPAIGGKFPRAPYEDIIQRAARINSYLTLLSYTIGGGGVGGDGKRSLTISMDNSTSLSKEVQTACKHNALAVLLADLSPTQHSIVSTLTLLSNALESGQSIPPHLEISRPYELTHQLDACNAAISSIDDAKTHHHNNNHNHNHNHDNLNHHKSSNDAKNTMTPAGYAECAVLQVCSLLVCDDLQGLIESVSKLVGVVDFSYCVFPSRSASVRSSRSSTGGGDGSGDNGKKKVH
ncbi:hypothetical protein GGR50DRAFT_672751 [Xylaria sp. CBS 124048]|nr:hypothetical protein GGR50DRAFT_672751 [Xylaria sp. CBS 124048]